MKCKIFSRRQFNKRINNPYFCAFSLEIIIKTVDNSLGYFLDFCGLFNSTGPNLSKDPSCSFDDKISRYNFS